MEKARRFVRPIIVVLFLVLIVVGAFYVLNYRLKPGSDTARVTRFEQQNPTIALKQFPLQKVVSPIGEEFYDFPCVAKSILEDRIQITDGLAALARIECIYYDAAKQLRTVQFPIVLEQTSDSAPEFYAYYSGGYVRRYETMSKTQFDVFKDELGLSQYSGQPLSVIITLAHFPEEDHPAYPDEIKFLKKYSNQLYASDQLSSFANTGDISSLGLISDNRIVFPVKVHISKTP